jgi:hypothetical protein
MRLRAGVGAFCLVRHCVCLSASALSFLILSCAQVGERCRGSPGEGKFRRWLARMVQDTGMGERSK